MTGMDPSLLDERKCNNAMSKLMCKPFEGMIPHSVAFLKLVGPSVW
jgi:hypothetical protein